MNKLFLIAPILSLTFLSCNFLDSKPKEKKTSSIKSSSQFNISEGSSNKVGSSYVLLLSQISQTSFSPLSSRYMISSSSLVDNNSY
jgi:hypothetical protein